MINCHSVLLSMQGALLCRLPIAMSLWNSIEILVDLFVLEGFKSSFVML